MCNIQTIRLVSCVLCIKWILCFISLVNSIRLVLYNNKYYIIHISLSLFLEWGGRGVGCGGSLTCYVCVSWNFCLLPSSGGSSKRDCFYCNNIKRLSTILIQYCDWNIHIWVCGIENVCTIWVDKHSFYFCLFGKKNYKKIGLHFGTMINDLNDHPC